MGRKKQVLAGEPWIHHSGNTYVVLCVTNILALDNDKFPITVVYVDKDNTPYSRPQEDFLMKFSPQEV